MPYVVKIEGRQYNGFLRGSNRNLHNVKGLTDNLQEARLFRNKGAALKYADESTEAHPVTVIEVEIITKLA